MNAEEFSLIIRRLMLEGVPLPILARVFDLDEKFLATQAEQWKIDQYGHATLDEYMEALRWQALHEAEKMIAGGTPQQKARFTAMVLGRAQPQRRQKQADGAAAAQRQEALAALAAMRGGPATEAAPGRFVAREPGDA